MSFPTRFWLSTGVGESDVSELEAIDAAFINSGLGYQNHVIVSSIPPITEIFPKIDKENGVTHIQVDNELKLLQFSSIIHVVRAMKNGRGGETIASSIALGKISVEIEGKLHECMLAYETIGSNLEEIEEDAIICLKNMVKKRNAQIDLSWGNSGIKIISSSLKVKKEYGCSISFVVFDPFTSKK
ncbi:MAG: hypothetical protein KAS63_08815 [Candidatus Heimdallarchaeota archaeon]|nr:hypothetical protein [Candidatus Heimdallarchaeota archaeon]MCK4955449.1 hypothetical protein [Candidatus Heimdallarchaeota archaeon]